MPLVIGVTQGSGHVVMVLGHLLGQLLCLVLDGEGDALRLGVAVVDEVAEQVQPLRGVRPRRDLLQLDSRPGARLVVEQPQSHQDDGDPFQAPHQVVRRLLRSQPEPPVRAVGAVHEEGRRALDLDIRHPPRRLPMEQHFDGAAENRSQPDRDARLQHVHEGVPRRGISVRAHEAADVIREVARRGLGDGTLVGNPMRVRALHRARPELLRRRPQLLGKTNRQ